MINETYWNDYYNFWDTFVKDWYDFISRGKTISERAFVSFGRASCINVDELPEPYLGSPVGNVEAVFLNLNPGMCQKGKYGIKKKKNLEATKFYSNIDKPDESVPNGWLIKEFSDEAKCSYKEFGKGVILVKLSGQIMTFYLDKYLAYKRQVHALRTAYVREVVSHILRQ